MKSVKLRGSEYEITKMSKTWTFFPFFRREVWSGWKDDKMPPTSPQTAGPPRGGLAGGPLKPLRAHMVYRLTYPEMTWEGKPRGWIQGQAEETWTKIGSTSTYPNALPNVFGYVRSCVTHSRKGVICVSPCACVRTEPFVWLQGYGEFVWGNSTGYVTWWNLCVRACQGK